MLKAKGDDMCTTSGSQHWPFRWKECCKAVAGEKKLQKTIKWSDLIFCTLGKKKKKGEARALHVFALLCKDATVSCFCFVLSTTLGYDLKTLPEIVFQNQNHNAVASSGILINWSIDDDLLLIKIHSSLEETDSGILGIRCRLIMKAGGSSSWWIYSPDISRYLDIGRQSIGPSWTKLWASGIKERNFGLPTAHSDQT